MKHSCQAVRCQHDVAVLLRLNAPHDLHLYNHRHLLAPHWFAHSLYAVLSTPPAHLLLLRCCCSPMMVMLSCRPQQRHSWQMAYPVLRLPLLPRCPRCGIRQTACQRHLAASMQSWVAWHAPSTGSAAVRLTCMTRWPLHEAGSRCVWCLVPAAVCVCVCELGAEDRSAAMWLGSHADAVRELCSGQVQRLRAAVKVVELHADHTPTAAGELCS